MPYFHGVWDPDKIDPDAICEAWMFTELHPDRCSGTDSAVAGGNTQLIPTKTTWIK